MHRKQCKIFTLLEEERMWWSDGAIRILEPYVNNLEEESEVQDRENARLASWKAEASLKLMCLRIASLVKAREQEREGVLFLPLFSFILMWRARSGPWGFYLSPFLGEVLFLCISLISVVVMVAGGGGWLVYPCVW